MDYSRQQIFDQDKLKKGKAAIVGAGPISNYLCAYLCGLGVGNITIIDDETSKKDALEFMVSMNKKEFAKRKSALRGTMQEMNDEIRVEDQIDIIGDSDVLVELTNDSQSKKYYKTLAEKLNKNHGSKIKLVISASSAFDSGSIAVYRPPILCNPIERMIEAKKGFSKEQAINQMLGKSTNDVFLMEGYAAERQGGFSSGIMAALCINEIRKVLSPLETDYFIKGPIHFDLSLKERFYSGERKTDVKHGIPDLSILKGKKALVVGAGGTGTYTSLNLALLGVGNIDIYDGDLVEDHNRNSQIFFHGKVGRPKASSLAERLSIINPGIEINGHDIFIDESILRDDISRRKYDIIFSCVDKWLPRRFLNRYVAETGAPLFDAAVSWFDSSNYLFYPGKNRCYECRDQFDFDSLVQAERASSGQHCSSSVIVPNAIAGALNAAESLALFFPDVYSTNYGSYIKYDDITSGSNRFSLKPIAYKEACPIGCQSRHGGTQ